MYRNDNEFVRGQKIKIAVMLAILDEMCRQQKVIKGGRGE